MKSTILWALVALNALLLCTFIGRVTHENAAIAQPAGGGKPNDPKAVQRHDGSWLLDGMLSVDEFKEIFRLDELPGEKRDAYQTLGGFVFTRMGRIPSVSDSFQWHGLRIEVVDMDGKRIDKVLVSPRPDHEATDTAIVTQGEVDD